MARDVRVSPLRRAPTSALALLILAAAACDDTRPPHVSSSLPPAPPAVLRKVSTDLESARPHPQHVWRDTSPLNDDGTVNGYIEIARGESTKWEFRIPFNRREVDRMIPESLGGYPTNYGFFPRTVSYDGDPADILVLGPTLPGGQVVRGRIVGLMRMTDTGDLDHKVVAVPVTDSAGAISLDTETRTRLENFFNNYKKHEGKDTAITGWGGAEDALVFLRTTAGFFASAQQR